MSYILIKGEFHIHYPNTPENGPEPDGDTLKFLPDNPEFIENLQRTGRPPKFNRSGMINLRFEAIDALETHYEDSHQNLEWANKARDYVLKAVGFENIQFFAHLPNKVRSVDNHPSRGFILANTLDPFGRIVCFVYPDDSSIFDGVTGEEVWLTPDLAKQSINAQLIEKGLVYPSFYSTLPVELRDSLKSLMTNKVRPTQVGLWEHAQATVDQTATINNLDELEQLVIWPKLFRRLVKFFVSGFRDLREFDNWLRQDPKHRDDTVLLSNGEMGNMHDLVEVTAPNKIRMTHLVENFVIMPDDVPIIVEPVSKGSLKIIAVLANPMGNDLGLEKVTLLNYSSHDIPDLGQYYITDKAGGRDFLPQGMSLAKGEAYTHKLNHVKLSNKGDSILIFEKVDGTEDKLLDQMSYSKAQGKKQGEVIFLV